MNRVFLRLCLVRVPLIGQLCHTVTKSGGWCNDRLHVRQESELSDFASVPRSELRQRNWCDD